MNDEPVYSYECGISAEDDIKASYCSDVDGCIVRK